jgi:hypothetical protein
MPEELRQRAVRVINHIAMMMYNHIFIVPRSGGQRKATELLHTNEH